MTSFLVTLSISKKISWMIVCEMDMDLIFNGLKVAEGINFPNRKKLNNSDIKSLKGFTVL